MVKMMNKNQRVLVSLRTRRRRTRMRRKAPRTKTRRAKETIKDKIASRIVTEKEGADQWRIL